MAPPDVDGRVGVVGVSVGVVLRHPFGDLLVSGRRRSDALADDPADGAHDANDDADDDPGEAQRGVVRPRRHRRRPEVVDLV